MNTEAIGYHQVKPQPKKPVKTVSSATKVVEKQPLYKFSSKSIKIFKNFKNIDIIKKYIMKNKQKVIAFVIIVPLLYHMITGKPLFDLLSGNKKKSK